MRVIGWRAWYADGSKITSRTASPESLPRQGLQIVVLYMDREVATGIPYREVLCGGDYLVWDGHVWRSTMEAPTCPTCVIFPGSWMSDEAFATLQQRAMDAVSL